MKTLPLLSVIVPICNVGEYLEQCLNSLAGQTADSVEYILIDDGSSDNSPEILKRYAEKNPKFRVITQQNQGVSQTRNNGIELARGKYIGFVDGDDWIEPQMFEKLLNAAEKNNADMASCSFYYDYENGKIPIPHDNRNCILALKNTDGQLKGAEELLLNDGTVWNRICRKEMIDRRHLRFYPEMTLGDDCFFYWTALISARKMAVIPDRLYHYRFGRMDSITTKKSSKALGALIALTRLGDILTEQEKTEMMPFFLHLMLSYSCYAAERLPDDCRTEFFEKLRDMLIKFHITEKSLIAMPGSSGGLVRELRYFILRLIHPLVRNAVLKNREELFFRIVHFREFLQNFSIKMQSILK